jgi:DNA polymerase-3 subunit delta'
LFLLVAQNQDQILNTIISRTQLVKVPPLSNPDILHYLSSQHHTDEHRAAEIAFLSNGNLTEALTILRADENGFHANFVQWLRYCFANKGFELMDFADGLAKLGRENQKNFMRYGINFVRECCMILAGAENLVHLPPGELETAKKMCAVMPLPAAEAIILILEKAHYHIERNANPKILFLDVSLQIVKVLKFKTFPQGAQYISN